MHKLLTVAALVAALATIGDVTAAAAATDQGAPTLAQPRPSWYTADLEARILAAGNKGVDPWRRFPPAGACSRRTAAR